MPPSHRYGPLPTRQSQSDLDPSIEMEAAFDDSDDDDSDHIPESRPLNQLNQPHPLASVPESPSPQQAHSYDFENVAYDYPPPGSPPTPSAVALPNDHGNSNGLIPSFTLDTSVIPQRRGWLGRTAASILPSYYVERLGLR